MGQVISYVFPSTDQPKESTPEKIENPTLQKNETNNQPNTENIPPTPPASASAPAPAPAPTNTPAESATPKPAAAPAVTRPQIDRSIFIQKGKKDETIIRNPGQINGNQFLTDKLENCKIIVHDFCDSMMIDNCVDCEFVLSAVRGSIFVRHCKNCKFAMVTGQFRCVDCQNCDFFMHVKTGPVVESSQNLKIGCALVSYPELAEHMKKARLDAAVNIWNDVHDFTPGEGHFELDIGRKLEMDILKNDHELITPFIYAPTPNGPHFSLKFAEDNWMEIVKMSQDNLKIENTRRENDGAFSIDIAAESEEAAKAIFTAFAPIEIASI